MPAPFIEVRNTFITSRSGQLFVIIGLRFGRRNKFGATLCVLIRPRVVMAVFCGRRLASFVLLVIVPRRVFGFSFVFVILRFRIVIRLRILIRKGRISRGVRFFLTTILCRLNDGLLL